VTEARIHIVKKQIVLPTLRNTMATIMPLYTKIHVSVSGSHIQQSALVLHGKAAVLMYTVDSVRFDGLPTVIEFKDICCSCTLVLKIQCYL
jgi:hypothetical protein